ncbi:MAG: carboxypeptidase-like regulatory domain-containing protein [Paludibacteraceae bacterium]|nr:carboxypeptidase-like regulatory domain-containing protein [Paludibacteraceae bacterium]
MRSRIFMFREAAIADVRKCNNEKSITTINGQVIDSKGEPIIAAQVIESGTSNGCLTDFDGKFTLKVKEDVILYVSCKGYNGQNVNARKGMTVTLLKNGEKSNMTNSAFHNNHEYVDLGLSVKWATCNVGARSIEHVGLYFAWGEISSKSSFGWNTYKHCKGSEKSITNYCTSSNYGKLDNKTQLHTFDDAAFANWGGNWRMPTFNEWIELKSKCKWKWCKQNGIKGYKITSNINGNSIFLPALGHIGKNGFELLGTHGYYWSSSLYSYSPHTAYIMQFSKSDIRVTNYFRCCGLPIRPVCP